MTKKQQEDNLFDNIDIEGLENNLITVDVLPDEIPPEDIPEKEIISQEPGGGDPGKKKEDKQVTPKEEDLIIVDQAENEDDDDKNNSTGTGEKDKSEGGSTHLESESPVYLHAAALQENGVLPNFDLSEIKDLEPDQAILKINEHIQSQIESSIEDGITEYKSSIGSKAAEFIKSLEEGVPFEDLADNYTLEERFGNISDDDLEENEEMQEGIYRNWLTLKGISDAKVEKMVKMTRDNGDLLMESKDGLKEIRGMIKHERLEMEQQAKLQKQQAEKRSQEVREKIKTTVSSLKEVFPGMKVSDKEKSDLIKMMTVPVEYKEINGNKVPVSAAAQLRMKDPISYEMRLNYLIQQGFFDADLKNDKIKNFFSKTESAASKKLVDKLKEQPLRNSGRPKEETQDKETGFMFPQSFMQM